MFITKVISKKRRKVQISLTSKNSVFGHYKYTRHEKSR